MRKKEIEIEARREFNTQTNTYIEVVSKLEGVSAVETWRVILQLPRI